MMSIIKTLTGLISFLVLLPALPNTACGQSLFTVDGTGPLPLPGNVIFFNNALTPVFGQQDMGLGPADVIDGFSVNRTGAVVFNLRFAVDRNAIGAFGTALHHQQIRQQHAGDSYRTTGLFSRHVIGAPKSFDNLLEINQDERFLHPDIPPPAFNPGFLMDNVNGHSHDVGQNISELPIYFSIKNNLNPFAGANIYFDPNPELDDGANGGDESLFASAIELGLQHIDEVDSFIVFDDNLDGDFNGTDQVIFSLAPGSFSLLDGSLPGTDAGDLFSIVAGDPVMLYAEAEWLGVGPNGPLPSMSSLDNINGLDIFVVPEPGHASCLIVFACLGLTRRRTRRTPVSHLS